MPHEYTLAATEGIEDPAEILTVRLRLYVRAADSHPEHARVMLHAWHGRIAMEGGYRSGAVDDVEAAVNAGRFSTPHPRLALMTVVAGATSLLSGRISGDNLGVDEADDFVEVALLTFGMAPDAAKDLAHRHLPRRATTE